MSIPDDGTDRGWAPIRPIRRAGAVGRARISLASAPARGRAGIGRYAGRHYCPRCGAKLAACRCGPALPPAA